jgi:hypothetical protein
VSLTRLNFQTDEGRLVIPWLSGLHPLSHFLYIDKYLFWFLKYEGRLSTFRNLRYYLISTAPHWSSENFCDRSDADILRSNIPTNILLMTWHHRKKILKTNKNLMRNNWLKIW